MRDRISRWARAVGSGAAGALLAAGLVTPVGAASVEIPGRRAPGVTAPGGQGGSVQADSRRGGPGWGDHRGRDHDGRRDGHGGGSHRPSHWGPRDHWNRYGHGWGHGWGHWGRPAPVWIPGGWVWSGWGWVWQPGYWR
jgi:hypothetical protein